MNKYSIESLKSVRQKQQIAQSICKKKLEAVTQQELKLVRFGNHVDIG